MRSRILAVAVVMMFACGCALFSGAKKAEDEGEPAAAAEESAKPAGKAAEKPAAPAKAAEKPAEKPVEKAAKPAKPPKPPKPAPTTATLAVTVNVNRAEVYIEDVLVGLTQKAGLAQEFTVGIGKHDLRVAKFGYEDAKATIGVEAGAVNTLSVELKRTPVVPVDLKKEMAQ